MERIKQFSHSLRHALRGLGYAFRSEKNFQNEIVVTIIVVAAMIYFDLTRAEMVAIIFMIMTVLIMELINTVFERVVDILKPRIHPYARVIKDLMAATVLITSIVAVIVGVIIFYPYIQERFF